MVILLILTVVLFDLAGVAAIVIAYREVAAARVQRDSYRLVAQLALKETAEAQDLLVKMAGVGETVVIGKKEVDRSWD